MLTAFHGTKYENAVDIQKNGFSKERFPTWTSDLGRGVYGFMFAKEAGLEDPKYLARSFPQVKYHNSAKVGVIKFTLDVSKEDLCDLNNPETQLSFQKTRQNFAQVIHQTFGNPKSSNAAKRDNEDGILIESLIQKRLWPDWKVIVRDTYTPLVAKSSNFPNSREVCVRDLEVITSRALC